MWSCYCNFLNKDPSIICHSHVLLGKLPISLDLLIKIITYNQIHSLNSNRETIRERNPQGMPVKIIANLYYNSLLNLMNNSANRKYILA